MVLVPASPYSLAVIVLSNLMSVGMIPLGMYFCSSAYLELDLTIIPAGLIMVTMFVSIGSIALGMAFRAYKEKWADRFVKVRTVEPQRGKSAVASCDLPLLRWGHGS